jgi:hypothetical protein
LYREPKRYPALVVRLYPRRIKTADTTDDRFIENLSIVDYSGPASLYRNQVFDRKCNLGGLIMDKIACEKHKLPVKSTFAASTHFAPGLT